MHLSLMVYDGDDDNAVGHLHELLLLLLLLLS